MMSAATREQHNAHLPRAKKLNNVLSLHLNSFKKAILGASSTTAVSGWGSFFPSASEA
jgi:hypothetical protein